MTHLFSHVLDVLEYIRESGNDDALRVDAIDLLGIVNRFEFILICATSYETNFGDYSRIISSATK